MNELLTITPQEYQRLVTDIEWEDTNLALGKPVDASRLIEIGRSLAKEIEALERELAELRAVASDRGKMRHDIIHRFELMDERRSERR